MIKILGTPTTSFIDRIKNITFAFFIMLGWAHAVTLLLTELNLPAQYRTDEMVFFMVCIVAPLWEEVVWRFAPITIAKRIDPKLIWPVIIISSAIFGYGHQENPVMGVMVQGVHGIIFSLIYIKSGTYLFLF